jgi:sporulation protein YlmC with PRC-barrel domain
MKKCGGISALAVFLLATVVAAQQPAAKSEPGGLMFTSRGLVGQELRLADGRSVGTVGDVVIAATTGRIEMIVVDLGDQNVAVPWSKVKVGQDGAFVLQLSRIELAQSPEVPLDASERTASSRR